MGCGTSCANSASNEREVVDRIRKQRTDRAPGYLSRDPTSLVEYQRLLARAGAITFEQNSDDSDDDDGLTKARSIVVIHRRESITDNSGWLADDAVGSIYGSDLRRPSLSVPSALRRGSLLSPSNSSSCCSNRTAANASRRFSSTLPLSQEFKRVSFDIASSDEISTSQSSPTHESSPMALPHVVEEHPN